MNKYGFDHRPAVHRASAEPAAAAKPTLLRALLLGTLVVVLIGLWSPYTLLIVNSSEITWSYFPIAIGTPFVLLVLLNIVVVKAYWSLGLRPAESALILVMGWPPPRRRFRGDRIIQERVYRADSGVAVTSWRGCANPA